MYVEHLVGDDGALLQAGVRIRGFDRGRLAPAFEELLKTWTTWGALGVALRVHLSDAGVLTLSIFVTSPETNAPALRSFFARFALIEGLDGADLDFPGDKHSFLSLLQDWPDETLAIDANVQTLGGAPLLCRAVWPNLLDTILNRMAVLGAAVWAHVNLVRAAPAPERQKRWARALIELENEAIPTDLRVKQEATFEAARRGAFNIETYWGAGPEHLGPLHEMLDDAIRAQDGSAITKESLLTRLSEAPDSVLDALHSFILIGEPNSLELAAGYATAEEANATLRWPKPSILLTRPGPPPPSGDANGRHGVQWSAFPPLRDEPGYVFISYAHADAAPVFSVLNALESASTPYWYDRGIPTGEQWDDELERKLSQCKAVVAFLSNRSIQSRYCRREIKYADILGKPIAPILIENIALDGGLAFILAPVQSIELHDPQLIQRIVSFIGGA